MPHANLRCVKMCMLMVKYCAYIKHEDQVLLRLTSLKSLGYAMFPIILRIPIPLLFSLK